MCNCLAELLFAVDCSQPLIMAHGKVHCKVSGMLLVS
eukprot:SAG11_NODE_3494_length_2413_cov_1.810285_3_plen_37_part_00